MERRARELAQWHRATMRRHRLLACLRARVGARLPRADALETACLDLLQETYARLALPASWRAGWPTTTPLPPGYVAPE